MIKIEYYIDSDDMSNEEFEDQPPKEFIITEDMIQELIHKHTNIKPSDSVIEIYIKR